VRRFSPGLLTAIGATKYLHLRAGDAHRFVAVWVVVVGGRVLVRSWNDRPDGWYRAFLRWRRGAIRLGEQLTAVRAVPVRRPRTNLDADRAYAEKYTTRANQPYVRGFATEKRRAHTLELQPAPRLGAPPAKRQKLRTASSSDS
jgi:hypothetical protein